MEDLQLGRTPIREALQRLSSEGLIFSAPRRGMFVADISLTALQKIFELRVVLEGLCARLAAQRATDEQLLQMGNLVHELDHLSEADAESLMAIDEQFHMLLYQAADNPFLADTLLRLHAHSFRLWYLVLDRLDGVKGAMEQHVGIADALQARDAARAEELIQKHVIDFQQDIRALLM